MRLDYDPYELIQEHPRGERQRIRHLMDSIRRERYAVPQQDLDSDEMVQGLGQQLGTMQRTWNTSPTGQGTAMQGMAPVPSAPQLAAMAQQLGTAVDAAPRGNPPVNLGEQAPVMQRMQNYFSGIQSPGARPVQSGQYLQGVGLAPGLASRMRYFQNLG